MKEKWRRLEGFPHYSVSNIGRVRRIGKIGNRGRMFVERILKPFFHGACKYQAVSLYRSGVKDSMLIHLLVLSTFAGKRPRGKEANHKDGNKLNNGIENLEWVTRSENAKHAYALGLRQSVQYYIRQKMVKEKKGR